MSKKILPTYEFPAQIQKQYNLLMNSKESFSMKISSADKQKLETLYGRLQNALDQNLTEILKMEYDQKSTELTNSQLNEESNWKLVKEKSILKYQTALEEDEKLTHYEEQLFEEKKRNLKGFVQKLRDDTQKREKTWIEKKQKQLKELGTSLETLDTQDLLLMNERNELEKKQSLLTNLSKEGAHLYSELNSLESNYQKNIEKLKKQLDSNLRPLRQKKSQLLNELKEKQQDSQKIIDEQLRTTNSNLSKILSELEKSLKEEESIQLKQLREDLLKEVRNCPSELKTAFLIGDFLEISKRRSTLTEETEKLGTALERELGKIGGDTNQFLKVMAENDIQQ